LLGGGELENGNLLRRNLLLEREVLELVAIDGVE
jgi:hypothetical protein